ncbi:MAG: MGMT family protein [Methylocella sp.]
MAGTHNENPSLKCVDLTAHVDACLGRSNGHLPQRATRRSLWIGAPKSVRTLARTFAANAIALAIPCHRAVRNDAALSGYR